MKEISSTRLKEKLALESEFFLLDVREPHEHEAFNIGGKLIPLGDLIRLVKDVPTNIPVSSLLQKRYEEPDSNTTARAKGV